MKILKISLLTFLVLFHIYLTSQKIDLQTADLGRHIKNGEEILKGSDEVFSGNFYSYTNSSYPFINHHWGSGIIFYLIQLTTGFVGQSIIFTLISLVTFLLFFDVARKYSNFYLAAFTSLLAVFLIGSRAEIRPEGFSYLLSGIFFWILLRFQRDDLNKKWLYALPFIELVWVNLHVYFPVGLLILGAFFLEETVLFLLTKDKQHLENTKDLSLVGVAAGLATLFNPYFIKGALYPLNIFQDYGYRILENQSFLFLEKIIVYPASLYFKIGFALFLVSLTFWVYQTFKKREKISLATTLLLVIFLLMSFQAVRNFALFGLFLIPFCSLGLSSLKLKAEEEVKQFLIPTAFLVLFMFLAVINQPFFVGKSNFGFGLKNRSEKAAEFFLRNNLQGPIFNNYDIGGYLIYYLFPKEKIFVDNRPEAYPSQFFKDVYIPMQENEDEFLQQDKKYRFNTIFFYRHDLTPWAQKFLISKVKDPNWVPIYVDEYAIVFIKNAQKNQEIIEKYKLPQEMFSAKSP